MSEATLYESLRGGPPYDAQRQAELISAVKNAMDSANVVLVESYITEHHPNGVARIATLTLRIVQSGQTPRPQNPNLAERLCTINDVHARIAEGALDAVKVRHALLVLSSELRLMLQREIMAETEAAAQ